MSRSPRSAAQWAALRSARPRRWASNQRPEAIKKRRAETRRKSPSGYPWTCLSQTRTPSPSSTSGSCSSWRRYVGHTRASPRRWSVKCNLCFRLLQKKSKRKEKKVNGQPSVGGGANPHLDDDPLVGGGDDDDVARLAREMEEKYVNSILRWTFSFVFIVRILSLL